MLHVASGDFEIAPCHFPAEKLQCDERGFKSIPLSLGGNGSRPLSGDVLLESWAVVLRYYVGSDTICFGRIDDATDSAFKYAVCHGEIPAQAALSTLHASTADIAGQSSGAQSPGDWIRSSPFLNTLVWNSSSPSASEHLLDTQVCYGGFRTLCLTIILTVLVLFCLVDFRYPRRRTGVVTLCIPYRRGHHRSRRCRMCVACYKSNYRGAADSNWRFGSLRSIFVVAGSGMECARS